MSNAIFRARPQRSLLRAGKLRFAFFTDGSDALISVAAQEADHLERERSIEGGLRNTQPIVERALGETNCGLATFRELLRCRECFVEQLGAGHAQADEPDALGFLPVEEVSRHQIVL